MAELYVASFNGLHDLWESGPLAVVHGDAHVTNLFEDRGRAGYFDWGCFSLAPPMRDVSYFLCTSLPVERRREWERELIEVYLDHRAAGGSPGPTFDDAWREHRLHAGYAVVAAAPAALYGGAATTADPAYSRAFVARVTAAVHDLESVEALRTALAGR